MLLQRRCIKNKKPILSFERMGDYDQDITSVTQLPFKKPVVLRPILSNSLPLSVISFSALEELSKVQFFTSYVHVYGSAFLS